MKIIGLSPKETFSGFQTSFFDSLRMAGADVNHISIYLPVFYYVCLLRSFHPVKKKWGPRWSHLYEISIRAFRKKSIYAERRLLENIASVDAVYQIGSLWDPLGDRIDIPFFLQVDYNSTLSAKRGGWKISPGREKQFWFDQELNLYNKASVVCTTTENARQSIIKDYGIDPVKVVTVGAGVSAPYDKPDPRRTPRYDAKKILFVGKGDIGKGLDTLLDAFQIVRKSLPDAILTLVGPKGLKVGNIEGINYMGRIADKERVKQLYYEHSLFVMPSRFEPFGQVFIEAMSCQLPCIGTTADAMPEIIEHGRTGYTIEPGDHKSLAEYMLEILTSPSLGREMGHYGFERLQKYYTWPVVGAKIYKVISENI
jgi:glycosyltransferase involved in cell wall biosynthesis